MRSLLSVIPCRQYRKLVPRAAFVTLLLGTCAFIHFNKSNGSDQKVTTYVGQPKLVAPAAAQIAQSAQVPLAPLPGGGIAQTGQRSLLASQLTSDDPLVAADLRRYVKQPGEPFLGTGRVARRFLDLSELEAQGMVHSKMSNNAFDCVNDDLIKIKGRPKQPGTSYELCKKGPFNLEQNKCLVYSFGVNDDWHFEESLNISYGCEIHSFDPRPNFSTVSVEEHLNTSNLFFHKMGLWGWNFRSEDGTEVYDLESITKVLGHQDRVIDVLKMDVEGAEWPVLQHLLHSTVGQRIKQINLEVHAPRLRVNPVTGNEEKVSILDLAEVWQTMHDLERMGFQLYSNRPKSCCDMFAVIRSNPAVLFNDIPKCCYKVAYVNTRFLS